MSRVLLFVLCFLPFLIAEDRVETDDEDLTIKFWCGVVDPYNVYNSRLVRVNPVPNIVMNGAGIVNIRNSVFEHCGNSLTLSMMDNKLANLTRKRLEGFRNLTMASFFNNVIEYVENGTFDRLPYLKELDLSYNLLSGLDAGVRSGLGELRTLHLNQNPIVLEEDGFLGLSKLELLELAGTNISTIPKGSFNGLSHLQRLELSCNKLTDISEANFEALIQLEELDLSLNQISKISNDTFNGLTNLRYLWLNNNQIRSLRGDDIFNSISNLKSLYLLGNPIQILDVAVFKEMQSVVIEPGFVIDFSETIRKNFAKPTSTLYQCSRLYNLDEPKYIDSEGVRREFEDTTVATFEYMENEGRNYFSPYHCVRLDGDQSYKVTMI